MTDADLSDAIARAASELRLGLDTIKRADARLAGYCEIKDRRYKAAVDLLCRVLAGENAAGAGGTTLSGSIFTDIRSFLHEAKVP